MFEISRKVLRKALTVTALSVTASFGVCNLLVPLLGGNFDGTGLWMSIICPLFIAFPVSLWQFHQAEKYRSALNTVSDMHRQLDQMHRSLRTAHEALEQKSLFDAMTGALTREAFFTRLNAASASGTGGALLLADADRFKTINDEHGHQAGDEALRAIGGAIAASLRVGDFWGRIGGEEFAIYLPNASASVAGIIAEEIRSKVADTFIEFDGERVVTTLSMGGLELRSYFDPAPALKEADRRLYRAKNNGRNRIVFSNAPEANAA